MSPVESRGTVVLRQRRSKVVARILLGLIILIFYAAVVWRGNSWGWIGVGVGCALLWMFGSDLTRHASCIQISPDQLILKHQLMKSIALARTDIQEFSLERGSKADTVSVHLTPGGAMRLRRRGAKREVAHIPLPLIDDHSPQAMLDLLRQWLAEGAGGGAA